MSKRIFTIYSEMRLEVILCRNLQDLEERMRSRSIRG